MLGKKKSLRDEIKNKVGAVNANSDMGEKIENYKVSVEMSGHQIAMLQNLMSYMLDGHPQELIAVSPNVIAMAETLAWIQTNMKKMVEDLGMEVPADAKSVSGQDLLEQIDKFKDKEH